jgi:hypothetical protein
MGWTWQLETREGAPSVDALEVGAQPADGFPSQAEAETWVGEVWRDLLAEGVDAVTLFEDGRRVYGPMSLHPQE